MNVKTWSEIFNEFGKTKPSRVGQVSPRRAAATYKQIEEQQKLNEETYAVPNGCILFNACSALAQGISEWNL